MKQNESYLLLFAIFMFAICVNVVLKLRVANEETCITMNVKSKSNTVHSLQRMGHTCVST